MSSSVRSSEANPLGAVGIPSSSGTSVDMSSQHFQAATPTLNNLLRGDTSAFMHPQGSQMQMLPHMQHLMGPPQGAFQSPQPSPIPNGSYSNPGSVGTASTGEKRKAKGGSRPSSRGVMFSGTTGQGGPPPQIGAVQNPTVVGLRMDGTPVSSTSGFSAQDVTQQSSAMPHHHLQQPQPHHHQMMGGIMPQQASGYTSSLYAPGYWPPQQQRYGMPSGPVGSFYVPSQPPAPQSAFSGYPIMDARPMMQGVKVPASHQSEMPRMPNGPLAGDWQGRMTPRLPMQETPASSATLAQQQIPSSSSAPHSVISSSQIMSQLTSNSMGAQPLNPVVSSAQQQVSVSSVSAMSPDTASVTADESLDDSKSLHCASPASWPHTPAQTSQGQRTPVPSGQPSTPGVPTSSVKQKETSASVLEKLVGPANPSNPYYHERRKFFEELFQFCESQGEPVTQVPQVSKQIIDLYRLYVAVCNRGGFEQVMKEKSWKQICTEANPEMTESSAAGYQLRRHYQKYLLKYECYKTNKNYDVAVTLAEKAKKRSRREKEPPQMISQYGPGAPNQVPSGHPGYGPHPADPSAYYYGHQVDPSQMHRPQPPHGWPPQGYQPSASVPGAPSSYPPGMRTAGPMRPPPPQPMVQSGPSIEEQQRYEEQRHLYYQQQQAAYVAQQQHQQQAQQSQPQQPQSSQQQPQPQQSLPGPGSLQLDSVQNRAPSVGPATGSGTPDSLSRLSAEDSLALRPPSHSQAPTATPPGGSLPNSQPSQVPMNYYGQTQGAQMYNSPGLRPSAAQSVPMSMKPTGYPANYGQPQTSGYPPVMTYPEGYQSTHPVVSQQQHALYQQQMWASQQAQRYSSPHSSIPTSSSAPTSLPLPGSMSRGPMTSSEMNAAQQVYAARRPSYFHMQQGAGSQITGAPSPTAPPNPRLRYNAPSSSSSPRPISQSLYGMHAPVPQQPQPSRPLPIGPPVGYSHSTPSTSAGIGGIHASVCNLQPTPAAGSVTAHGPVPGAGYHMPPSIAHYSASQPAQFPLGSVEATIISQRRRRKIYAKDLLRADPRRLIMSLRSSLEAEITWALNALNVLLYDDMATPIRLREHPALLNVLVEHFRAQLALLFPTVFKVSTESKVRTVDDDSQWSQWSQVDKNDRTIMKHIWVAQRSSKTEPRNFTKISRTGRDVAIVHRKEPEGLKKLRPDGWTVDIPDVTLSADYFQDRVPSGLSGSTSAYVFTKFSADLEMKYNLRKAKFGRVDCRSDYLQKRCLSNGANVLLPKEQAFWERFDSDENVVEFKTLRPTALCNRDESRLLIVRRCLSISNILRGLSFLQDLNDELMCRHSGLLYILGRLLRLCAEEKPILKPKALLVKQEPVKNEPPAIGELSEATKRLLAPGDLLEPDDDDALLLQETANQLRDDAFVILAHISGKIDLYDFDSDVSWAIFDGLLHWCVSKSAEATDVLPPGCISPRNYCLEMLCKMSVIEHNIDLLVSTGPWQRIERFVKNLAGLLAMNEEIPYREFAIVILHAICAASEAACVVTALDTPAISHLVAFLEAGDTSFHQVAQQHGMLALRENPELVGTSVGMLRKAAMIMLHLSRIPVCRKQFFKHQQLLLQFTMSQLMDSKVGATIADVLYEMQRGDIDERREREERKQQRNKLREALINGTLKEKVEVVEKVVVKKENETPETDNKDKIETNENAKASVEEILKPINAIKEVSPPPAKRQRLENGTLNHVYRNGSGSIQRPLLNGDVSSQSIKTVVVSSMPPRKNTTVVENGTGNAAAGSVQAVA